MEPNLLSIFGKIDKREDLSLQELETYADWSLTTPTHGRSQREQIEVLRQYRRRSLDAADSLLDVAKGEGRGLLASEQRIADKAIERGRDIGTLIEKLEQHDRMNPSRVPDVAARSLDLGDSPAGSRYTPSGNVSAYGQRAAEFMTQMRAMGSSTLTGGGAIVPSGLAQEIISQLTAESVALRSGIRLIETPFDVLHLPKTTSDPTASWTGEHQEITATDAAFGEVLATAHKLASLTIVSNELMADSNPSVAELLFNRITRSLSLTLDLAIFEGTGLAYQIQGLRDRSGISSDTMGANGAAFSNLDPFADAIGTLAQSNAKATAIVMHPRSWKALIKLKEQTSGNNKPLLQESSGSGGQAPAGTIYGLPVFLSAQLSITETQGSATNASSAYIYQADQIALVRHRDIRIEVDRSRYFEKDQTAIRGITHVDLAALNEAAVYRLKGIIP